ncbi:MAG: hypothetical protein LUH14_10435 [Clostridiaceae bacterium]|nr:hypothetical protein [Clostridiaceae bacterium]
MSVTPDYLEGNGTDVYTPEEWLDEVVDTSSGETIQEGTPMDAEHFNHMEQGIHNNSMMLAIFLEYLRHAQQSLESVDGEEIEVTLTNAGGFYFNDSVQTVALSNMRSTTEYRVLTEIQGNTVNAGDIVVYDKQVNGFKIAHTGSAESVKVRCFVQGGGAA